MATYYPLHHKALVWPLSACCQLKCIAYSALHTAARVPAASSATIVGDDITIKSHDKTSNKLACSPISMRLAGHMFLFNLNIQTTAANDNFYKRSA